MWFKALILLLLSLVVRLSNLEGHSLHTDELTWMVASKELIYSVRAGNLRFFDTAWWTSKDDVQAISLPNTFLSGLFYYFTVAGQSKYSPGWFSEIMAVRLPGAILGAIFPALLYLFSRKHAGNKTSFIAAALFALDPVSVGLSRYLKQDSTLTIFSFLSIAVYLYPVQGKIKILCSALLGTLAFLTKPQGLFIPLVLGAVGGNKKDFITWLIVFGGFIYLIFPYLWKDPITRFASYIQTQYQVSQNQGRLVFFQGKPTTNPSWYFYILTVPYHIIEPVLLGLAILVIKRKLIISSFTVGSIFYVALIFVVVSFSSIKLGTNYIYPIWPYLFLAGATGLVYLPKLLQVVAILWSVFALAKLSPNYYLFYNLFTSPQAYQNRETVGFCDGIKPAVKYLQPYLHHGTRLEIKYCYASAQYYTPYALVRVDDVKDKPEFVVIENSVSQVWPGIEPEVVRFGYHLRHTVSHAGLELARIYSP